MIHENNDNVERILTLIQQVPAGCVATYGQIAKLAGIPKNSRQVGSVLKKLPTGSGVPWYRIVNSKGEISDRKNESSQNIQRMALEEEGVSFDNNGRIRLKEFQWSP